MYIDKELNGNNLKLSVFDSDGRVDLREYTIPEIYSWEKTIERDNNKNENYLSLDGEPVRRIKSNKVSKFLLSEYFKSLDQSEQDIIFSTLMPNIYFCDIETEIDETSNRNIKVYTVEAINKVNTISILSPNNEIFLFTTKYVEKNELELKVNEYIKTVTKDIIKIVHLQFADEFDMLQSFFKDYVIEIPLLTGWNFEEFDWKYLVNRATNIGVDVRIASPSFKIDARNNNVPLHRAIMDYLSLYKKWDRKVRIKENFSLDFTAKAVLGITKIKYDGKLQDLYNNDFFTYCYYNIIDTILVKLIHDKLKTITIPLTLSAICKIPIYKNDSAVNITEALIFDEMLNRNKVVTNDYYDREHISRLYILNDTAFDNLVSKSVESRIIKKLRGLQDLIFTNETEFLKAVENSIENKKDFETYKDIIIDKSEEKYQGAFVKEPIKGRHKFIACFDFASLYPTTMRQFDISVENYIDKYDTKQVNELRKTSLEDNTIVCANGVMFNKCESILKTILTDLYKRRKIEKKKMFECEQKINELKEGLKKLEHMLESIE